VQNLFVHRFANSIFEPIWNRDHVHHVQITAAETVGVEHRARYYEEAGVIRDMFQNHLLQLLALTAMEPPNTFSADAVRNEKVKVIEAIRDFTPAQARHALALGQYGAGMMDGKTVPGYRQESGVDPASRTPTFAALRLDIQNWRWQGVPFFLRSGKRMARRVTEIAVQFRRPPHTLFKLVGSEQLDPNVLAFRIQPEEGISLRFEVKAPGVDIRVTPVRMIFSYADAFGRGGEYTAYETLILDCMEGDATLFNRADAVEEAWRLVDPLVEATMDESDGFPNYAAGSWGPASADELIGREGAVWRTP
jgi:glucose-6-phosphate 1-dehydrogenase